MSPMKYGVHVDWVEHMFALARHSSDCHPLWLSQRNQPFLAIVMPYICASSSCDISMLEAVGRRGEQLKIPPNWHGKE